MSQNLHQAGVKLLNALSRHADLIMQVYLSGTLQEADSNAAVVDNLKKLGVFWRPEPGAPLRLKKAIRNLLEASLHDERNRQLDANIGSALASLKTLAQHYKEALHHHRYAEAQAHLNDLTEHVYGLTESLSNNVRLLFSRINNEFGYVASIDAKIRENELAQSQVSELLNQLEMFRFDELSEVAGGIRELRHLLVVALQQSFSRCTQELSIAQARLLELLGRFREFRGRTRLLKGFVLHMEQHPDFQPSSYVSHSQVPALFNIAAALLQPAAVDVNRVEHEQDLLQLVGRIKALGRSDKPRNEERVAQPIDVQQQASVELTDKAIHQAVEQYFCEVIDTGKRLTALEYFKKQSLEFDPEVWIYQVIGGYQGLPEEDRQYFELGTELEDHPIFSGNKIVRDVELGLR
ncbi:phosphoenolpyruvate carboxylase [Aliiglaciecola sp. CAU 1673]|uniref:phosphoenolpyruvate carboxylase n=1 Tax=Aliiglaciecola sp. CAU 1673 TaxID=3032595 RepID=UPI0023DCB346|nr:phosphoenolpyruvate carboxylase [Aliiglaciecola sp. CAU 1673]MDF2176969.1 phosphoenolpyruvate carboxylase [Aliiglaciecola sp. CAU 1673]